MLGRLVKEHIQTKGKDYPLGQIAHLITRGDLIIFNLECAITDTSTIWQGPPKPFYFGAPSEAAEILADLGVHIVSLANNHSLDFDFIGLSDTLNYLSNNHILYTGAGDNLEQAQNPAIITCKKTTFAMVAFCDHQEDFKATQSRPGMAYLDLSDEKKTIEQFHNSLEKMQQQAVDWPILSLHWGPNMVDRPSNYFVHLAHAAIDLGYKTIFGHSAHVFHGIELYQGYPIIYAAGDLVDDYAVDAYFRNDHQLLFELILENNKLISIHLHPVFIDYCQTKPASPEQFEYIAKRAQTLCEEMGSTVERIDQKELLIKANVD